MKKSVSSSPAMSTVIPHTVRSRPSSRRMWGSDFFTFSILYSRPSSSVCHVTSSSGAGVDPVEDGAAGEGAGVGAGAGVWDQEGAPTHANTQAMIAALRGPETRRPDGARAGIKPNDYGGRTTRCQS